MLHQTATIVYMNNENSEEVITGLIETVSNNQFIVRSELDVQFRIPTEDIIKVEMVDEDDHHQFTIDMFNVRLSNRMAELFEMVEQQMEMINKEMMHPIDNSDLYQDLLFMSEKKAEAIRRDSK